MKWLKQLFCRHLFDLPNTSPRDKEGNLIWACCKCSKIFKGNCGLYILRHINYTDRQEGSKV